MEAGQALNILVGVNVMDGSIRNYSEDIAAAWLVVEKVNLSVMRSINGWVAGILREDYPENGWVDCDIEHYALAPTAAMAICMSALYAVGALAEPDQGPRSESHLKN